MLWIMLFHKWVLTVHLDIPAGRTDAFSLIPLQIDACNTAYFERTEQEIMSLLLQLAISIR